MTAGFRSGQRWFVCHFCSGPASKVTPGTGPSGPSTEVGGQRSNRATVDVTPTLTWIPERSLLSPLPPNLADTQQDGSTMKYSGATHTFSHFSMKCGLSSLPPIGRVAWFQR